MQQQIRSKKVIKRIGELLALGLTPEEIKAELNKDFKLNTSTDTIRRVIKSYSIRRKEIIQQDERINNLVKESVMELIKKVKSNLKVMESTRKLILDRLEKFKKAEADKAMVIYIREINSAVRTLNDCIKTENEVLKRLESDTKETRVSTVQSVQMSLSALKELENLGLIEIKDQYYLEKGGK